MCFSFLMSLPLVLRFEVVTFLKPTCTMVDATQIPSMHERHIEASKTLVQGFAYQVRMN